MYMYNADARANPLLAQFVQELGDRVKRKSSVYDAVKLYGTQSEDHVDNALKWGTKPFVVPHDIGERYGYYDPQINLDWVFIDYEFEWMLKSTKEFTGITWTENGQRKQFNARPAAELLVEAKVLHEIVHWLDYTADDLHLPKEAGNSFEKKGYGKVLNHQQPQFSTIKAVFPEYFKTYGQK